MIVKLCKKQAFSDESLNEKLLLTSANSINAARYCPNKFITFWRFETMVENPFENPVILCSEGNFWNILCWNFMHHRVYLWNILLVRVM